MEDQSPYGIPEYELPNYLEKVQSQLPALHLLILLGWKYLTPEETVSLRSGRLGSVILEPVLVEHIRQHCRFEFKGMSRPFTENAIQNAVQALKSFRATGATHQNEHAYDLLCLGTSVPQTIEGDTKSFTINYIDWKNSKNNTYHCTAEYKVERTGFQKHYIPDIVLFVNGIPVCVIECKRSAYTDPGKDPVKLAIDQLGDYQAKDGIPQLFLYTQLLLALARDKAKYGTTGTPRPFWALWREERIDKELKDKLSEKLDGADLDRLLSAPFKDARREYLSIHEQGREIYEQDMALYSLCRPERLLELAYKFILFDNGVKKIARYQQYFTVHDIIKRALSAPPESPRPGGVVWHTQGSGKSLTMVMLAKSLALHPAILNPKIILVTDRIDLDDQICGTFRACGLEPEQANTGKHLVELLSDQRSHIVTTLIHKFATATSGRMLTRADRNTFVLVDEGHRGQYERQHSRMRLALKGACFIAFTGTPLAKSAKRNTFSKFGELFRPPYTISRAVEDNAVKPLLYEGRYVPQKVDREAIDNWFEKITLALTRDQKADLKRKFSTERQLNKAVQKVRMVAWDISLHYTTAYQGTGMKGQLVTPFKGTALKYKEFMDEFGMVKTDVLISGPYEKEGEENNADSSNEIVKAFWDEMMDRFGSEKNYNKQLINSFKHGDSPEIIIVVDKLLTGFDAPCNTVLYLARKLKEHTLLQAIARVNRLYEGKEYGLILDYSGVIEELDEAIDFYSQLADYDKADLAETVTYISDKISKLPQLHSNLWEMFGRVKGIKDPEVWEVHLRDNELRNRFYERFSLFARTLSLALSSTNFLESTPAGLIRKYNADLKYFQNLRAAVTRRYQEIINFSEYEPRLEKLINTHVGAGEVQQICKPVNLLDARERQELMKDNGKSKTAKADMIVAATRRVIEQEMAKDPAFYRKFSRLLEQVIEDLYSGRIKALEALEKTKDISTKVITHTDDDVPYELVGKDMERRFYGCVREPLTEYIAKDDKPGTEIALRIVEKIAPHKIRDWRTNQDALNKMRGEIDDILFEVTKEYEIELSLEEQDAIIDRCIEVAIANED
ncbi:MAG TPA: HsdR family type I site-specific deoxyribonuclease [Desulfobacteraceae bacterium]|nr:HsdR family type I site-specific deoxyribonuclease [Desulfobacteraceae bacterium]HPJ68213.1 HsdR family type I site-specific deoxyribonuclease [Desulfobacteraceae bacterium]HPQ28859.1 HsdR family type I site-specific deoxyribonuclease [Desulfobacteraceae bacterium]